MDTTDNEQTNEPLDWRAIARALQAPFDPAEVDFRVQGKAGGNGKAQVVAYVDARCVQDRLDAVVGPGAWSFDWNPINFDAKGEIQSAKGMLTIYGVTKADIGSASNFEASLGAVSHCFKRAAVLWGVGRYLYSIPSAWVEVEQGGRLSAQVIAQLRAKLPRPNRPDGSGVTMRTMRPVAPTTPVSVSEPDEPPATAAPPRPATPRPTQRAKAPNPWLATDGYDPISDSELRRRVKALGINNMLDFETFLTDVRTRYKVYSEATILNELLVREKSQAAARAKVTPQTPQTPQAAQAAQAAADSAPIPHDLHGAFTPARGA